MQRGLYNNAEYHLDPFFILWKVKVHSILTHDPICYSTILTCLKSVLSTCPDGSIKNTINEAIDGVDKKCGEYIVLRDCICIG